MYLINSSYFQVYFHQTLVLVVLLLTLGYTKNLGLESNDITENFISININWLFDKFLKQYKDKLIEEGKTEIIIENFEEHFSQKLFVITIQGHMSVTDGSLKNLTTLHRTGDVTLDKNDQSFILTAYLGMTDFQVIYKKYELELVGLTQRGNIHAAVGSNSVCVKILIILKPECKVQLQSLEIETLDHIDISITGLGPLHNLVNEISSWIVTHIAHSYRSKLQNVIFQDMERAIEAADLCHYF